MPFPRLNPASGLDHVEAKGVIRCVVAGRCGGGQTECDADEAAV